jgi:hypothetical protein
LETERRGVPATTWYHLDLKALEEKVEEYQQNAGIPQTRNFRKQVCRNSAGKFTGHRQTISKTTSKITSKNTTTRAQKPKTRDGGTKNVVERI